MGREIVIFEDAGWKRLYPITLSRATFECRTGASALGRRLLGQLNEGEPGRVGFLCREYLRPLVERQFPGHPVNRAPGDDVLFLNGRLLCLGESLQDLVTILEKAVVVQDNGELVAARVTGPAAARFHRDLEKALASGEAPPFPPDHSVAGAPEGVRLVRYPWDLVAWNRDAIEDDFARVDRVRLHRQPELSPGAQTLHRDRILALEGVKIEAGAIVDAGEGPVILAEGVHVRHNAVILGPAFIGPRSVVNVGAKLEGSVSLGPVCKVGGEVENSIFQGYANKQHDGFLGHSYLGAWTNLGAATNNSDLKNNYSTVRVWTPEGTVDTGQRFVGLFLGDHSKSAIGTTFNTGTVVGFSCNVFGAGFPPKHVPSFSWGGAEGLARYDLDKAIEVARVVMARRDVTMEPADEVLFRTVYGEATSAQV